MRRFLVAALASAAVVGAAAVVPVLDAPEAAALNAGQVLGRYAVKLKGDGFGGRRTGAKPAAAGVDVTTEHILGGAQIEIAARDAAVNDGLVTVRIVLDADAAKGLLGAATPGAPAFEGTAAMIGDSIAVIDSGQPNYVNALVLRFDRQAKKVQGTWMAVFPSAEPGLETQRFAAGVTVAVTGRRTLRAEAGRGLGAR